MYGASSAGKGNSPIFNLFRQETLFFRGPCVVCARRFSDPNPILGHRNGPTNQANYSGMACCNGPVCESCSHYQKAGKGLQSVTKYCLFCSDVGEKSEVLTTRQINHDRTSIEWTVNFADPLCSFEKAAFGMPFLFEFLCSIPYSQRSHLALTWKRVRDKDIKVLYESFLQRSLDLWKSFLSRNLTFNPFSRQCDQKLVHPHLFWNRLVRNFKWTAWETCCVHGTKIFQKSVQRIPPEFIFFCSMRMVVFEHSFQRKLFQAIIKRVLKKFICARWVR